MEWVIIVCVVMIGFYAITHKICESRISVITDERIKNLKARLTELEIRVDQMENKKNENIQT